MREAANAWCTKKQTKGRGSNMRKKGNKAWVWLVGALLASSLTLGCASVQTGGAAKEEEKPVVELADANAKEGSFWKDDEVIMKFGERDLSYADMKNYFLVESDGTAELTELPKDQQMRFFNKFFFEKLFAKEAKTRGLENSQDYLDRTRAKRYSILVKIFQKYEIAAKNIPSDEYLMQSIPPAEDEVQVRVIVKDDPKDAQKVYQRIKAGEDFIKVWEEQNEGLQKADGGLSPWLSVHNPHKFPPPTIEKFLGQPTGALLEPFYMDIGFLVIKIADKRPAEFLRKKELENQRSKLTYDYQKYKYDERMKELRQAAKVVVHEDVVDSFATKTGDRNAIIVEIDGDRYPASEVLEELIDAGHGGQPVRQRVDGFVESALAGREAIRLGLDKHPAFVGRWNLEEDRTLARELSRTTVKAADKAEIKEDEIVGFIKANPDKFLLPESRLVLAIMTEKKEKAEEAIARLDKGEEFAKVAADLSTHAESSSKGGELGWSEKSDLPKPFQEPLFSMDEGAYTKTPLEVLSNEETPIWFVVKVGGVRKPSPAPIERVNLRTAETKLRNQKRASSLGLLADEISFKFGYKLCID